MRAKLSRGLSRRGRYPGGGDSYPDNLTNMGGTLYFSAYDPTNGYELWKSDGTAAGTTLVKDVNPVRRRASGP